MLAPTQSSRSPLVVKQKEFDRLFIVTGRATINLGAGTVPDLSGNQEIIQFFINATKDLANSFGGDEREKIGCGLKLEDVEGPLLAPPGILKDLLDVMDEQEHKVCLSR